MNNKRCVVKIKLKDICKSNINYEVLHNSIKNVNQIINIGSLFMRSYILYILENNKDKKKTKINEPIINIHFIRNAISVIMIDDKPKKGRPFNKEKDQLIQNLKNYFELFKSKTSIKPIVVTNISYILGQSYEQIYISIINNIKYHFDKHLWKYIKINHYTEYETIIQNKNPEQLKEYYLELEKVKNDIYDNTLTSNIKYHTWIKNNRKLIIPQTYTKTKFEGDVERNTFNYIKCMHYMNNYMQANEIKSYQIFPIRTSCYDKYIKINTSALIDMFYGLYIKGNTKIECLSMAGDNGMQEMVWNKMFYLKSNGKYKFKRKGFSFNYEIETNGFDVSLNFINNNEIQKKENKKENFRKGRLETANNKKNMSEDEYNKLLKEKIEKEIKQKEEQLMLNKQKKDQLKKEFNQLPKEEQDKIKNKLNKIAEFPYIDKLLKNIQEREEFQEYFDNGKIVVCDPGKRSPLYLMSTNSVIHEKEKQLKENNFGISIENNRKIMNYTNNTRMMFTKRKKYGKLIESWKSKNSNNSIKTLKDIETELGQLNSKSCNHNNFLEYIKKKQEYDLKAFMEYDTDYIKKLHWFAYLNRENHENDLINHISNEFGNDIKIIIGDWSNTGRLKFISTPNLRLKRKLAEYFNVYLIDEYNTSIIHYKYHIKCDNLKVPNPIIPNEVSVTPQFNYKSLHSVLTFKIVTEEMGCKIINGGCINRDKNSVRNMETILVELLKYGKRPSIFSRSTVRAVRKVNLFDADVHIGTQSSKSTNKLSNKSTNLNKLSIRKSPNKKPNKLKTTKDKPLKLKKSNQEIN